MARIPVGEFDNMQVDDPRDDGERVVLGDAVGNDAANAQPQGSQVANSVGPQRDPRRAGRFHSRSWSSRGFVRNLCADFDMVDDGTWDGRGPSPTPSLRSDLRERALRLQSLASLPVTAPSVPLHPRSPHPARGSGGEDDAWDGDEHLPAIARELDAREDVTPLTNGVPQQPSPDAGRRSLGLECPFTDAYNTLGVVAGLAGLVGADPPNAADNVLANGARGAAAPDAIWLGNLASMLAEKLGELVDARVPAPSGGSGGGSKPRRPAIWEGRPNYTGRAFIKAMEYFFEADRTPQEYWVAQVVSNMAPAMQAWLEGLCIQLEPPQLPGELEWDNLKHMVLYGRANQAPHLTARQRLYALAVVPGRIQEFLDAAMVCRADCQTTPMSAMSDLDFIHHVRTVVTNAYPEMGTKLTYSPDGKLWEEPKALFEFMANLDQECAAARRGKRKANDFVDRSASHDAKRGREATNKPTNKKFTGKCNWCQKPNHKEVDCLSKKAGKPRVEPKDAQKPGPRKH